jgi:hypothetical protein
MRTSRARSTTHRAKHPDRKALGAWTITLAATAVSTYVLEALATAGGVLLVASQLLSGLGQLLVLALLVATYVLWGVALRAKLGANWSLLQLTGTSTNAFSKAAFELTSRRRASTRRVAAAAGYVVTELAKDVPYYAGAFGAAAATDSVSANDALIFMVGTNLGAAAYEYGVARLTRRLLRRGPRRRTRTACHASAAPTTAASPSRTSRRRSPSSPTPRPARRSRTPAPS